MSRQEQIYQAIEFFLLSILIFDDFHISDDCINLLIKNNLERGLVEYFLSKFKELTLLDFYMLRSKGAERALELYCPSDPFFFSKVIDHCTLRQK
ncbi:MAG: hypothetical protein ACXADY_08695 [Candidatus Hodarchaeales archaeon]|jgi:hypothetical protein